MLGFVTVVVVYVLVFWLQNTFMPETMMLMYLPHGVRCVAFVALRFISIPALIVAHLTCYYLVNPFWDMPLLDVLWISITSALTPALAYICMRKVGIDPFPRALQKEVVWQHALLFFVITTCVNGPLLLSYPMLSSNIPYDAIDTITSFVIGDFFGVAMVLVSYFAVLNLIRVSRHIAQFRV